MSFRRGAQPYRLFGRRQGAWLLAAVWCAPLWILLLWILTAHADMGTLRVSWSDCDPPSDVLCLEGIGQVAQLYLSVQGVDEPHVASRIQITLPSCPAFRDGPQAKPAYYLTDAWRFDASGCNHGYLSVETDSETAGCPAFQGANPLSIWNYHYDDYTGRDYFDMLNAYESPVLNPDPDTRYLVYRVNFDFSHSDCGESDPEIACGGLERGTCLRVVYTEVLRPDYSSSNFRVENDVVYWQWYGCGTAGCGVVQNRAATWGRVKGLYR